MGPSRRFSNPSEIRDLLIIVAMQVEEDAILKGLESQEELLGKRSDVKVRRVTLGERRIHVAKSGVGLVCAGLTTALAIEALGIDAILVLGVGGALSPDLAIGDTVIANRVLQHDSFYSGEKGNTFMAPGELFLSRNPEERADPALVPDPILVEWLTRLSTKIERVASVGTVLSGSEFLGNVQRKIEVSKILGQPLLVDMETSAVAQVAHRCKVPFAAAKTVADRMLPDKTIALDYKASLSAASANSALISHQIVSEWQNIQDRHV